MNVKASGRSALIIAAGLLVLASAPLIAAPAASSEPQAEDSAPKAKKRVAHHHVRHLKKHAAASHKDDAKADDKAAEIATAPAGDSKDDATLKADAAKPVKVMAVEYAKADGAPRTEPKPLASSDLPASVANANAQLADAAAVELPQQPPAAAPDAQPAPQAQPAQAVPAQALPAQAAQPPAQSGIVAADEVNDLDRAASEQSAPNAAAPAKYSTVAQVTSATGNDGAWDTASLVGKIFIAVGGLLTLASAARMFLA